LTAVIDGTTLNKGIAGKHRPDESTYRNNKVVWLLPTRGMIPLKVYVSLRNMFLLMNQPRACMEIEGREVAAAYNEGFSAILADPKTESFPWVWTYEEDNIQQQDTFHKLFQAIWTCIDCNEPMPCDANGSPVEPWVCQNGHKGLDAIGGLYHTKSIPSMPMAYGDPKSEELEFRPLQITQEMEDAGGLIEVNGLAMGCTLFRKGLFEKVSRPWFKTLSGAEGQGAYTQDLYFCRKAKEEYGARFAVHLGVQTGHLDVTTGEVF
jgi:hypothetical protein